MMRDNGYQWRRLNICVAVSSLFLFSATVRGQDGRRTAPSSPPASEAAPELRVLADLIRDLQSQVQTLNSQLGELRTEEQRTSEEARELRQELDLTNARMLPSANVALNSSPESVSQG